MKYLLNPTILNDFVATGRLRILFYVLSCPKDPKYIPWRLINLRGSRRTWSLHHSRRRRRRHRRPISFLRKRREKQDMDEKPAMHIDFDPSVLRRPDLAINGGFRGFIWFSTLSTTTPTPRRAMQRRMMQTRRNVKISEWQKRAKPSYVCIVPNSLQERPPHQWKSPRQPRIKEDRWHVEASTKWKQHKMNLKPAELINWLALGRNTRPSRLIIRNYPMHSEIWCRN